VKHGRVNATLPKSLAPDQVTLDRAVALIAERAAKAGSGKRAAPQRKKAAPADTSAPESAATSTAQKAPKGAAASRQKTPSRKSKEPPP